MTVSPTATSHFVMNNVLASIIHDRVLVDVEFINTTFINLFNLTDTDKLSADELVFAIDHFKPFFIKACPDLAQLNFTRCNRFNISSYIDKYEEDLKGGRWIEFPYTYKKWQSVFKKLKAEAEKAAQKTEEKVKESV